MGRMKAVRVGLHPAGLKKDPVGLPTLPATAPAVGFGELGDERLISALSNWCICSQATCRAG